MSLHRIQDLLFPPGHRAQAVPVGEEPAWETNVGTTERRLAQMLRRFPHDDEALVESLRRLGRVARHAARIVAIRELGAERAKALCARAFGETAPPLAVAEETPRIVASQPTLAAVFELARARGLADVLELVVPGGRFEDSKLGREVSAAAEPAVALAGLSLLRAREGGHGAAWGRSWASGLGDAALHHPAGRGAHASTRAAALVRAAEVRAVTLFRRETRGGAESLALDHPAIDEALGRSGRGECLPDTVRRDMEARFGVDFHNVRVHTDSIAARAAEAVRANAFTVGEDIFFAEGAFDAAGVGGRELLAHELTHVVQAYQGRIPTSTGGGREVSRPDDALEREAGAVAARVSEPPHPGPVPLFGLGAVPRATAPVAPVVMTTTIHRAHADQADEELVDEEQQRRARRRRGSGQNRDDERERGQRARKAKRELTALGSAELRGPSHVAPADPGSGAGAGTNDGPRPRSSGPLADAMVKAGGDSAQATARDAIKRNGGPDGAEKSTGDAGAGTTALGGAASAEHGAPHGGPAHGVGAGSESPGVHAGSAAGSHGAVGKGADGHGAHGGGAQSQVGHGHGGHGHDAPGHQGSGHGGHAGSGHGDHGNAEHDGGHKGAGGPRGGAPPLINAGPPGAGGDIGFAESDVDRLVPQQPGEQPEARQQRINDVRQQLAQDRAYATARLGEFSAAQGQRIAALNQLGPQIDRALEVAAQQAAAQISQAATAQSAAIRAEVAGAQAQAQTAAAAARSQIEGSYAATIRGVETATRTARAQIEAAYQQSVAATRTSESRQIGEVGRLYAQAESAFHAAANAAGSHAMSVAHQRAAVYRRGRINHDDSFLDGPLTDNRCEAQAEAADKVGQSYRDELAKEGDKQVAELRQRRPTDDAAVHQVAAEARQNLDAAYRQSLRALDDGRRAGLDGGRQVRDGALAGTARTLQQTQSSLRHHEQSQLANISRQAATHKRALGQQRAAGSETLRGALQRAMADFGAGLDRSLAEIRKAEVPERAALDQTLTQAGGAIEQQIAQLRGSLDQSRDQVRQGLAHGGVQAGQAITQAGSAAMSSARSMGSGAVQALAQGAQSAGSSLQQAASRHQQSATAAVTAATQGQTGIADGLDQAYGRLSQSLQQGMQRNADAVRNGLTEVVDRDMSATITSEAQKAYDQVKPRWQSILRWVIIIAIVLVVAIVLGPMVIGAITGLAAGLGASAAVAGAVGAVVGGAIVGAGTAAVTTVVDNAFAGRTGLDLFHGVGTAMAWGALGGALGGGASALLAGPMQGMTALARYGVQVGVDTVVNTGLSAMQGNLTWENFGTGLLMSMLVNGVSAHPRVRAISEGAMSRGYGAGFEGGIGLRNRITGATPPGPTSIAPGRLDHVAQGDTHGPNSPNAGKWNLQGGGHVPGEIIPRANAEGVPHATRATDPVSGVAIERFIRPNGQPTDKSLFPPGTSRPQVEVMGTEGLNRALTGAPGSSLKPPTSPNTNGEFTATVMGPNGHPIEVSGYYRPNGSGGYEVQSVFPTGDRVAGTIPVAGGPGLGGSRTLPIPTYSHPTATTDREDR